MDFTDSANPFEIAYFDRGAIDAEHLVGGGYWSAYWYQGRIYGTEIYRGLDVFRLLPSEFLTANEIRAAELANQGALFNPQQQFPVSWPAEPVVALAYLDQLQREQVLPETLAAELTRALEQVQELRGKGQNSTELTAHLEALATALAERADPAVVSPAALNRLEKLRSVLLGTS